MSDAPIVVTPGPDRTSVRMADGRVCRAPDGWVLVPPGDAALTRRIKAGGPCWVIQEKRGRRTFSQGLWTDGARVDAIRAALESERADPAHAKKRLAAAERRAKAHAGYVEEFRATVLKFLDFPLQYHELAERLAGLVTDHATPVGSGTVARTQRISVERRAESAVIAWMRHRTTAYDGMRIARVKGRRRETRRMLAERSRELLDGYRRGAADDAQNCPLRAALTAAPM